MKPKIFLIPPPALPVPATQGGAVETLITHLMEENELQQQMELVCVSIPDPDAQAKASRFSHSRVHYLPHRQNRGLWGPVCGVLRRLGRPAPLDAWYNKVGMLVRREQPDAVVTEGGDIDEPAAIAALVGRNKMWAHLHMQIECTPKTDAMYGGVLSISQYVAQQWGSSTARTALVPNCVNTALFCPGDDAAGQRMATRASLGLAPNDFAVLFCGRICPEKGVHRLVEALHHLPNGHIKLVIVGSPFFGGQAESAFQIQLKQAAEPFKERIRFTGFVPNGQMPLYYRAADAACFPALWEEPAGITAIEAMACGCPVIATESGGMPEYLAGSEAILLKRDRIWNFGYTPCPGVPPLDETLAQAIAALQASPERCARMAAAGARRAEAFSRAAYYQNFVNALLAKDVNV